MLERKGLVSINGNPLTLLGAKVKTGEQAPDFNVIDNDLGQIKLSDYAGKVVIILSVPSLDTPICDIETRRFNNEAASLSDDVVILTISMDLPFAQKRWCGANGVDKVITLSDHRYATFGQTYGLLIKELRLLARAVLVIDRQGVIRYQELVGELGQEPDYPKALQTAFELV